MNNKIKEKFPGCAPQIDTIIKVHADRNKKLVDEDLECGYSMETLTKLKIVEEVEEYVSPDEAWEKLMTMDSYVAIFATLQPIENGVPGHVVVYDLDTRTERTKDGKVMMCDPQDSNDEKCKEMDFQEFKNQVVGCEKLRLYTVDLEKLCEIVVVKHKKHLHNTEETFDNAPEEKACNTRPEQRLRYGEGQAKRKDEILRQLQREGKLSKMNCASAAIRWTYINKTEVEIPVCIRQLEAIMIVFVLANSKIDPQDLRCDNFMKILSDVGIVELPNNNEYVLANKINNEQVIVEAWEKLMTMNEKVCILGIWRPDQEFWDHVVVCDLDTRTSRTRDGKVMFHDPQAPRGETQAELSLKDFIEYVRDSCGLMLFTVNLEELNRIMVCYKDELHKTYIEDLTSDSAQP